VGIKYSSVQTALALALKLAFFEIGISKFRYLNLKGLLKIRIKNMRSTYNNRNSFA